LEHCINELHARRIALLEMKIELLVACLSKLIRLSC
jgi:hypothetical protein